MILPESGKYFKEENMSKVIDIHSHFFPKEYLDYMAKRKEFPNFEWTGPTSGIFHPMEGVIAGHVHKPGHYDAEARIKDMDELGVDAQVLSLTAPDVQSFPPAEGVIWAKKTNDCLAEICQKYPGRFYALATLPFQDIDESLKELDRAYKDLGLNGITMFSNINGKPITLEEFYPIYEKAAEYELPVMIHPALTPLTAEAMKAVKLPFQLFGFTLDTSLAVVGLIFQGVLEKYPKLKLLHCHLGGVVPYLVGRMEIHFGSYAKEWGHKLPKTPSEYYKSQVYVDSISMHMPAMKCCLEYVGADHICMGTDYPHRGGDPKLFIASVRDMPLSEKDINKVLGENAIRLLKLE